MASLPLAMGGLAGGRVFAATAAAKSESSGKGEKSFVDWLLGSLAKQDQFYETDPILKKVEEKSGSSNGTTSARKGSTSVSVPASKKKNGGFGGLFAKK